MATAKRRAFDERRGINGRLRPQRPSHERFRMGNRFVLGGLCSGGLLAAALTLDGRHGVAGLAMLSPTFDYDGWGQTRWRHLRKAGYALGLARWISIPEREPFGVKNPKIRAWVAREMRERASSASGPSTLPLWADPRGRSPKGLGACRLCRVWIRARSSCMRAKTMCARWPAHNGL